MNEKDNLLENLKISSKGKKHTCSECPWYKYRGQMINIEGIKIKGLCMISNRIVDEKTPDCYYRQLELKRTVEYAAMKLIADEYKLLSDERKADFDWLQYYYNNIYLKLKEVLGEKAFKKFIHSVGKEYDKYCKENNIKRRKV